MRVASVLLPTALLFATGALAQDAPAAPSAAPAPAAAVTSAQVTDQEVNNFAQAAVAIQKINADATVQQDQKQPAMAAAVKQAGLEPQRFNEIARGSQADTQLMQRIQLAAANQAKAAAPQAQ